MGIKFSSSCHRYCAERVCNLCRMFHVLKWQKTCSIKFKLQFLHGVFSLQSHLIRNWQSRRRFLESSPLWKQYFWWPSWNSERGASVSRGRSRSTASTRLDGNDDHRERQRILLEADKAGGNPTQRQVAKLCFIKATRFRWTEIVKDKFFN